MKAEILSDALDNLNDDIIERTARLRSGGSARRSNGLAWAAALVFAAALAAVSIAAAGGARNMKQADNLAAPTEAPASSHGRNEPETVESIEVCYTAAPGEASMIPFFIYGGREYMQDYSVDGPISEAMLGSMLGTAKGNIYEWSTRDDYTELAGSVQGGFYEIKGCDPAVMLAYRHPGASEYYPFVSLRSITPRKGGELYEDMLHIGHDLAGVTYEAYPSWNYSNGEIYRLPADTPEVLALIAAADEAEFTTVERLAAELGVSTSRIYASGTYELDLELSTGVTVRVSLLECGGLLLDAARPLVLMPDAECFNRLLALMDAKTGTQINDPTPFELSYAECINDGTLGVYIPRSVPEDMRPVSAELIHGDEGETTLIMLDYRSSVRRYDRDYFIAISSRMSYEGDCVLTPDELSLEALEGLTEYGTGEDGDFTLINAVLELDGVYVEFCGTNIEAAEAYAILNSVAGAEG